MTQHIYKYVHEHTSLAKPGFCSGRRNLANLILVHCLISVLIIMMMAITPNHCALVLIIIMTVKIRSIKVFVPVRILVLVTRLALLLAVITVVEIFTFIIRIVKMIIRVALIVLVIVIVLSPILINKC